VDSVKKSALVLVEVRVTKLAKVFVALKAEE
jgi:hypothetical protein